MKKPTTIFIKTFGCQMSFRDSEFVTGLLLDSGFALADSMENADIIIFNSCSVRKHAEDRLISNISDLKLLKKRRPGLIIGLMGCTAQSYKSKILERLPILDFSCGPGNESDIPGIIKDILENRGIIVATDKIDQMRPELFPAYREDRYKAYVSIGEGCNNFCSYCIVPYVRGSERSRVAKDIIKEVKDLAGRGFKEVMLLGQNVNSYGKVTSLAGLNAKTYNFVHLLEDINSIKGIERIRFMTSHPKDASTELFKAMRDLEKVCEHLHLPLQSGSDRILKLMNRGYTAKKYMKTVEEYRKYVSVGSVTTDIIVGFPSETKNDFGRTVRMIKDIEFDGAYMFKYSPRPPAKSSGLKDSVSREGKEKRLEALINLQREISLKRNELLTGKVFDVLVDGENKREVSKFTGRTGTNKVAVFDGSKDMIGRIVGVKIESVTPHALKGRVV
ncbi:MAG: tRNA (N6-isopentenyl adenosine(37)-C2)-methylthiotransferase MiaB [Candidatus Omnitrophota bacterium]